MVKTVHLIPINQRPAIAMPIREYRTLKIKEHKRKVCLITPIEEPFKKLQIDPNHPNWGYEIASAKIEETLINIDTPNPNTNEFARVIGTKGMGRKHALVCFRINDKESMEKLRNYILTANIIKAL